MFEEIFKRFLDKLTGADFWIVLGFLVAGVICWLLIGTKTQEKKVLHRQIGIALVLVVLAGGAIWVNHFFFLRDPAFSKNASGILVMRVVGDDALDSLQAALVENLNRELQEEAAGQQIEVHAGRDRLDDSNGLPAAHERAQIIGQRLNAKLVIWGRKIGQKEFYPYITVTAAPKNWSAKSERPAVVVQNIAELHLPKELVDEPFYLIHFAAGYSYYLQKNYKEAVVHFKAALRRKGALPIELADLQAFTGICGQSLAAGQKTMGVNLQEAIGLYEKAAKVYEGHEEQNEKRAVIQNNLGVAYSDLPTGDRAANLQKAIAAYEAALQVRTEKDFPVDWTTTQINLGSAYWGLPTGDRAANVRKAIAAYEAALRVYTEKDFPVGWALTQNNLGGAYMGLPTGDRAANLQKAKVCFEAALRVYTESGFPESHRDTVAHLADVEHQLRNLTSE